MPVAYTRSTDRSKRAHKVTKRSSPAIAGDCSSMLLPAPMSRTNRWKNTSSTSGFQALLGRIVAASRPGTIFRLAR